MKQPELIIDKERKWETADYTHYCPVCSERSRVFYLSDTKTEGIYEFIDVEHDIGDLVWSQLSEIVFVISEKKTSVFNVAYDEFPESHFTLTINQFQKIVNNKKQFYKSLNEKLIEFQPMKPVKLIDSDVKSAYGEYISVPNFCSKKCAKKFIISIIEKL